MYNRSLFFLILGFVLIPFGSFGFVVGAWLWAFILSRLAKYAEDNNMVRKS